MSRGSRRSIGTSLPLPHGSSETRFVKVPNLALRGLNVRETTCKALQFDMCSFRKSVPIQKYMHHCSTFTRFCVLRVSIYSPWKLSVTISTACPPSSVCPDGSLYLASPVDPLFLILSLLDKARMKVEATPSPAHTPVTYHTRT